MAIGRHVFELVRSHCGARRDDRILDIGSGCGRAAVHFTEYLDPEGSYDGFDVVLPMVEWCRNHISQAFPHFRFQHADLKNTRYSDIGTEASEYVFPYPDNSFDVVFATSVFTHLLPTSAERYANEIARVLKPHRRAILTFFIINDDFRSQIAAGDKIIPFPYSRGDYAVMDENKPEAVIAFEETRARQILEGGGLRIVDMSYGFWRKPGGWTYQDVFLVSN